MAVKLLFNELPQFVDANGDPYSGAKLFTYVAGSSTKQTTYQDSGAITANSNPIVCDSAGRVPYPIWGTTGVSYKLVLAPSTDTDPPTSPIFTIDNVTGINDTTVSIDQWVSGPTPTYVSATSFTLAGDQTSTFQVGRRVKTTNSGGTVYSTIVSSVFGALTTIKVVNDSGSLDSGLSAVSYGLASAANPSVPFDQYGHSLGAMGFRLSLASGTAVTTTDQTAKTTAYMTPYKSKQIDLYSTSRWVRYSSAEVSVAVPSTTSTPFDVFAYADANGAVAIETTNWSSDTARATSLTTQDGILVKSGDATRRYIGTARTTTVSGQCEDSYAKRYVYNYYNRVPRPMRAVDTTDSWTYTTAAYRQANGNAANQLDFVIGVSEEPITAEVLGLAVNSGGSIAGGVAVGLDGTSVTAGTQLLSYAIASSFVTPCHARYNGYPGAGRHTLLWLEFSTASGTTTWYGDGGSGAIQSGIFGTINA